MPVSAPASASVTLSTCPDGTAKSTRAETSVPTAPDGAPASSSTAFPAGVFVASTTGASLTAATLTVTVACCSSPRRRCGIAEARRAVEVRRRRERHRAVVVEHRGAAGAARHRGNRQVWVARRRRSSLPSSVGRRVDDRGVLGRRQRVSVGHRRVVDRADIDRHGRRRAVGRCRR